MDSNKDKYIQEAKSYEQIRDHLGRDQLDNFRLIKSHIADWYVAIAAVCFAIGGIAITVGKNVTKHPALFWWGSVLLIANGIFIFFARKVEIQSENSGFSDLKQKEADLWTMSKIAREHAAGDNSRSNDFVIAATRFIEDYDERSKALKWWQKVKFVVQVSLLDITFGLLLFPILMLMPQLPNYLRISFEAYAYVFWIILTVYFIFMMLRIDNAVKDKRRYDNATRQIKNEVEKNRTNYSKTGQSKTSVRK